MKSDSPKQRLIVDVRNSSKIRLVVEEADNGDTWDHADWADAKFRNLSKFDLNIPNLLFLHFLNNQNYLFL